MAHLELADLEGLEIRKADVVGFAVYSHDEDGSVEPVLVAAFNEVHEVIGWLDKELHRWAHKYGEALPSDEGDAE